MNSYILVILAIVCMQHQKGLPVLAKLGHVNRSVSWLPWAFSLQENQSHPINPCRANLARLL
jgi:hypothetical protein